MSFRSLVWFGFGGGVLGYFYFFFPFLCTDREGGSGEGGGCVPSLLESVL